MLRFFNPYPYTYIGHKTDERLKIHGKGLADFLYGLIILVYMFKTWATVVDGFADRTTYARMNGSTAVSVAVTKRSGTNMRDFVEGEEELLKRPQDAAC